MPRVPSLGHHHTFWCIVVSRGCGQLIYTNLVLEFLLLSKSRVCSKLLTLSSTFVKSFDIRVVPKGALARLVSRSRELQYYLTLRHTCLSLITTWNIALHNQHPSLAIPIILQSLAILSAACHSGRHSGYCAQIPAFQCTVLVRQLNQIGHPGSHWRPYNFSPALCSRSHC